MKNGAEIRSFKTCNKCRQNLEKAKRKTNVNTEDKEANARTVLVVRFVNTVE